MSAYNELMALINSNQAAATQQDEGKSFINKTLEVLDTATSVAYAHVVDQATAMTGAVVTNVEATPKLARDGFARGQERAARALMKFMAK